MLKEDRQAITKVAESANHYRRSVSGFERARDGFRALLRSLQLASDQRVLLPAYVGWSAREGSGVFDPIRELGLSHSFYRIDRRLNIDVQDFESKLRAGNIRVVVLIHFFGAPDPSYHRLATLARHFGAFVVEDEAHALFTDFVGGVTGRLGDAILLSLHKMLPVKSGGVLLQRQNHERPLADANQQAVDLLEFDLPGIAAARMRNVRYLESALGGLTPRLEPLWAAIPSGVIPQTYPVIVHGISRDQLYFDLNEAGFGAVSLYHTLIDEISAADHPDSHWLARRILNLPVHQDATENSLVEMVETLRSLSERAATWQE